MSEKRLGSANEHIGAGPSIQGTGLENASGIRSTRKKPHKKHGKPFLVDYQVAANTLSPFVSTDRDTEPHENAGENIKAPLTKAQEE